MAETVAGGTLTTIVHAVGGPSGAAPVVLLHGFGADRLSWSANTPALTPAFQVFAVDLPGHGAAPAAPDGGTITMAALADSVAAALTGVVPRPFHLVGHSLGGAVALVLADRNPADIRSLALIAPAGLGVAINPAFARGFATLEDPDAAKRLLETLVTRPRLINDQMVAHVLRHLAVPGVQRTLAAIGEVLLSEDAAMAETAMGVVDGDLPRLTLWGAQDRINPLQPTRLERFGGEQMILPDAGHMPHVESLQRVNRQLGAFLAAH